MKSHLVEMPLQIPLLYYYYKMLRLAFTAVKKLKIIQLIFELACGRKFGGEQKRQ